MGMKSLYETPEVSMVELRPSEAVLGNCKVEALYEGPGFGGADCVGVPPGRQCLWVGS